MLNKKCFIFTVIFVSGYSIKMRAEGSNIDLLKTSQLLTDEYAIKILVATARISRSAQEISEKFGIPIAACYRRIRDLQNVGLLECTERKLTQSGKRVGFYKSTLKNAYLFYENGKFRVKFQVRSEGGNRYGDEWHDIEFRSLDDGDCEDLEK
ncbi:MAG: winged helix-turn-helix domain-containing protein [Methanomassiliicoccales archaeon]